MESINREVLLYIPRGMLGLCKQTQDAACKIKDSKIASDHIRALQFTGDNHG